MMQHANTLSTAALLSLDITDPTDFPPTSLAPGLRQLDSALRCNICRDLFDGPVTLHCGHCFCSICIRSTLATKQECPSCLKPGNEGHLRINPAMEEAVTAWKEARGFTLRLSKAEERRSTELDSYEVPETPQKSGKKRKRLYSSNLESPRKAGPSRGRERTSGTESDGASDGDKNSDNVMVETLIPSSDAGEEDITDEGIVECPMCQGKVRLETINTHIDTGCSPSTRFDAGAAEDRRSRKSQWSKILGGGKESKAKGKEKAKHSDPIPPDPLPKVAYNVLKDKQLKDLLLEHKLSVTGDRASWIARHQRWVMVYNANLDKSESRRKTLPELRSDLKKWEEDRKTKKNSVNDVDAHQKIHRAEFSRLVEAARPGVKENNDGDGAMALSRPATSKASIGRHRPPDIDEDVVVVDSEEERAGNRHAD